MNIKAAANMLRLMIREGGATMIPPRRVTPAEKVKSAPEGPKGLPSVLPNDTATICSRAKSSRKTSSRKRRRDSWPAR